MYSLWVVAGKTTQCLGARPTNTNISDIEITTAPYSIQTWENDKIKSITSYHSSNHETKYAEYEYDWNNNLVNIKYYDINGKLTDTISKAI